MGLIFHIHLGNEITNIKTAHIHACMSMCFSTVIESFINNLDDKNEFPKTNSVYSYTLSDNLILMAVQYPAKAFFIWKQHPISCFS